MPLALVVVVVVVRSLLPAQMSSDTILVRATEEQYRLTFARQLPEWGNGFTLARFTARELEMRATPFGQALQCWYTPLPQLPRL